MKNDIPITQYCKELNDILGKVKTTNAQGEEIALDEAADIAARTILSCGLEGSKTLLVGNGGSAAIVSHMQNDMCDSVGVRAFVFNEPPFLTAVANDHGYQTFFEQAVKLWAEDGDLLIAISSSGRSESILRAVQEMRKKRTRVITMSGFAPDNPLRGMGDINFYVPASGYGMVETSHAIIGHYLTDAAIAKKNRAPVAKSTQ